VATPSITQGQIALDPINRIFYYLDSNGTLVNSSLNLLQESNTSITTEENLTVNNITVLGNTTVIDSTVTTIKDPIITLGGKTAPTVDDNKDRGIEFRWYDGSLATPAAKVGFFGFDDSSGKFTFIPDATNTSEVFSGTIGELAAKIDWDNLLNKPTFVNSITGTPNEIDVTATTGNIVISLPATGAMNISGTAAGWTTPRKITLGGDLEGNVLIDGGANVTLNAYVTANSVALGTDTTGNYVASLIAGTGITLTNNSGEQAQPTVAVTTNTYDAYGAATTAEVNAASDASIKAATAYTNATTYVNTQLGSFGVDNLSDVTINTSLANSYLKYNGSAWVNDQIDLSTDTTGSYVQSLVAGAGITISNNSGENATPTITANVTLDNLTDVNVPLVGDGQLLAFDGNSNTWVAKSALDLTIPSGVQYTTTIGDGSSTEFLITHGLTTVAPFVVVMKKNASNNFEVVNALWEVFSSTQVKVYFEIAPASGEVKVLVFGNVSTASLVIASLDQLPDVITSGASAGDVLFRDGSYWVAHAMHLNDLADVQGANSAANGQFLKYNGSAWVSANIPTINTLDDVGDVTITSAASGDILKWNGTAWVNDSALLAAKAPLSSPTFTGTVSGITATMVGLGNVNNTADTAKPVSTAQQTALDLKATIASPTFTGTVTIPAGASISGFATLASPTLTGIPTAPTATLSTNTTQLATTAFVRAEVANLVNSAGATLDTLGEIATALGNDAALSTTLTNSIALKAPLASPTFTGTVTLPANTVTSAMILDGTIANIDISSSAAIGYSKLALSNSITTTDLVSGPARAGFNSTLRTITSSNTLVLSDLAKLIVVNSSSTANITVPADNTVNFDIGDRIDVVTVNTGSVSFVANSGVTVNGTPGLNLRTQYSGATLVKLATNTWVVMGDLKA
jgi:hypothetical protein